MTTAPLRELLSQLGYAVHVRGGPWIECLVSRGFERWQGGGACKNGALGDVVRQMLPSGFARQLLADRSFDVAAWAASSTSEDRQLSRASDALRVNFSPSDPTGGRIRLQRNGFASFEPRPAPLDTRETDRVFLLRRSSQAWRKSSKAKMRSRCAREGG